ncbi:MAG: methylated-DNA--[protein]-cysteine S-methyltransferase, partial [Opitutaceae bacterium]
MKTHPQEQAKSLVQTGKQTRKRSSVVETIRFAAGKCSLGLVLVAASEKGVCFLSLGEDRAALLRELEHDFPHAGLAAADQGFDAALAAVIRFVENPRSGWKLPLDLRGSAFQHRVWQALSEIPAGSTMTYAAIAERIEAPKAVRAVGSACAANKISVIIPCHRAVRVDGSLAGFRWGLERKRALLEKEAVA